MKPISKANLTKLGIAGTMLLSLSATSCRDLSIDAGRGALTCAASSVAATSDGGLTLGSQLAQSFKPQATVKNVSKVNLGLQLVGTTSLSGYLYVTVVGDKNHQPDLGNALAQVGAIPMANVTTTPQSFTFDLGSAIAELTAKSTYWIVLSTYTSSSPTAHIVWLGSDVDNYSDGQALSYSSGPGWLNPDAATSSAVNKRDLSFQIGCL